MTEELVLELARLERAVHERQAATRAALQKGELWKGLQPQLQPRLTERKDVLS